MKLITSLFTFLPQIIAAIFAAESAIQAEGAGASKKAIILAVIEAAAQVGEQVPNNLIAGVSALVDSIVNVLNKTSVFAHATK